METVSGSVPVITEPTLPYDSERWDSWLDWAAGEPPHESRTVRDDSITVIDDSESGDDTIVLRHFYAQPTPLLSGDVSANADDGSAQRTQDCNTGPQYSTGKFDIGLLQSYESTRTPQSDDEGMSDTQDPQLSARYRSPNSSNPVDYFYFVRQYLPFIFFFRTSQIAWSKQPITTTHVPDEEWAGFPGGSSEGQPHIQFFNGLSTTPRNSGLVKDNTLDHLQKKSSQPSIVKQSHPRVPLVHSNFIPSPSLNSAVTPLPVHPHSHIHILPPRTSSLLFPPLPLSPILPIPTWRTNSREERSEKNLIVVPHSKRILACVYTGPANGEIKIIVYSFSSEGGGAKTASKIEGARRKTRSTLKAVMTLSFGSENESVSVWEI
ncbi:hypothetical protein Clacol_007883 [Clathrus columnatus]|uniref:Uncharacterized protein n=1 Tax=Clathrus columnatus TaxID=1419009 RepID=A0AAV5AIP0_9AGAM|nr:hypothetical protein Clacol_007883 [Clathrus columnatus]